MFKLVQPFGEESVASVSQDSFSVSVCSRSWRAGLLFSRAWPFRSFVFPTSYLRSKKVLLSATQRQRLACDSEGPSTEETGLSPSQTYSGKRFRE